MIGSSIYQQCTRKKKYHSLNWARKVAKHEGDKDNKVLRVYYCGCCDNYHLTHKPLFTVGRYAENESSSNN